MIKSIHGLGNYGVMYVPMSKDQLVGISVGDRKVEYVTREVASIYLRNFRKAQRLVA